MSSITINNIGPLSSLSLILNKVNVLMGPQSSGKSTIVKIVSFCQWAEKRFILDGKFDYDFKEFFIDFHKISESYFTKASSFIYDSDFVTIRQKGKSLKISIKSKNKNEEYKRSKNIFIPAERNFVSAIPNLGRYNEVNDNIMSFLYDWYDAKKNYSVKNSLPILNLGASYHYVTDTDADILTLQHGQELQLNNASSGLQSVTPLVMLIDYLTDALFSLNKPNSVDERDQIKNVFNKKFDILINRKFINSIDFTQLKNQTITLSDAEVIALLEFFNNTKDYHFTNFIIEEPEQNLFPITQRDLIYHIFDKIVNTERPHSLFITTHSPFVLYAINNCMMGKRVSDDMPAEEQTELQSHKSWINPSDVSIYQMDNGQIKSVIDERTGTVTKHYFNESMNELMNEYYEMLNYFKDDQ